MSKAKKPQPTNRALRKAVLDLGGTPEQIARTLRRKRIVGNLGQDNSCPIANYLKSKFGGRVEVDQCDVRRYKRGSWDEYAAIPTPKAASAFVEQFDAKQYPSLIRQPKRKKQ